MNRPKYATKYFRAQSLELLNEDLNEFFALNPVLSYRNFILVPEMVASHLSPSKVQAVFTGILFYKIQNAEDLE